MPLEGEITKKHLEGEYLLMGTEFCGVDFVETLQGKECCMLFECYFSSWGTGDHAPSFYTSYIRCQPEILQVVSGCDVDLASVNKEEYKHISSLHKT